MNVDLYIAPKEKNHATSNQAFKMAKKSNHHCQSLFQEMLHSEVL
jgi:hypothetical protein